MINFELKVYPDTTCERLLSIKIGTMREIAPNDKNYDPDKCYGWEIDIKGDGLGESYHGFSDRFAAESSAMLRAVAYGNGGFPLETMLR